MMRHLVRAAFLTLVIGWAIAMSSFAQFVDPQPNAGDANPALRVETQERAIGPKQGLVFSLGAAIGVAYFTLEPAGFRLVATIQGAEGTPVRFTAMLAPEQAATVSVPGKVGEQATEVSFLRRGEELVVKPAAGANN
jgi:hypothetical protein